jgi:hypothetical protein
MRWREFTVDYHAFGCVDVDAVGGWATAGSISRVAGGWLAVARSEGRPEVSQHLGEAEAREAVERVVGAS